MFSVILKLHIISFEPIIIIKSDILCLVTCLNRKNTYMYGFIQNDKVFSGIGMDLFEFGA